MSRTMSEPSPEENKKEAPPPSEFAVRCAIAIGVSVMLGVLFADGTVEFLPDTVTAKDLQAMLTIAGGEKVVEPQGW